MQKYTVIPEKMQNILPYQNKNNVVKRKIIFFSQKVTKSFLQV